MTGLRAFAVAVLVLLASMAAHAHDPNLSAVRWVRSGATDVVSVTVHQSRLEAAEGRALAPPEIDAALRRRLRVQGLSADRFAKTARLDVDSSADIVRWEFHVPRGSEPPSLAAPLLPEDPRSATVFQEVREGKVVRESLLESAVGVAPEPRPSGWTRWLREGLMHIAGGWDHLCFVIGLVLVARRLGTALAAVSLFTVAHALTLAAAVLGWVRPPAPWVEALVALSIACIAGEALFGPRDGNRRLPFHALGFGLVHGLAFAGGLAQLLGKGDSLLPALAGFNVGVEIGQIVVASATGGLLVVVENRWPLAYSVLRSGFASAIGLAGLWWLGARVGLLLRG